ncbi:hypothetical protein GCM10009834_20170 [Streptomonospora arabica]
MTALDGYLAGGTQTGQTARADMGRIHVAFGRRGCGRRARRVRTGDSGGPETAGPSGRPAETAGKQPGAAGL